MNYDNDDFTFLFFTQYKDYFDKNDKNYVSVIFQKYKTKNRISDIAYIKFKHPMIMLCISILFGWIGIDRILLGHKRKAIRKIIMTVAIVVICYIYAEVVYVLGYTGLLRDILLYLLFFLAMFMFLHLVIDIYNVHNDTYKYNLDLLSKYIEKRNS